MSSAAAARAERAPDDIDRDLVARITAAVEGRDGAWIKAHTEVRFRCPEGGKHTNGDADPSARWNPAHAVWRCDGCKTGGGYLDIARRLGLELPRRTVRSRQRGRLLATYDYTDEAGTLLYQVQRFETPKDAPKDFSQRRPNGTGGWIYKLDDVRRVLYRLPELVTSIAADKIVYVAEGEKDVDRLRSLGLTATTNPGGAGKWRSDYNEVLRAASVVILPDNDDVGRAHAAAVATALHGIAATVSIVALPGLPEKGDVSDWLAAGGTPDALAQLVTASPPWTPSTDDPPGPRAPDLAEFLTVEFPPRENIMDPVFPRQGLGMVHAWRGLGKTYFALWFAYICATSGRFLKWRAEHPRSILYVDGEMRGVDMQQRAIEIVRATDTQPGPGAFRIITPDLQDNGIPDLGTAEGQQWIEGVAADRDLIVLDNLSSLLRLSSDKEDEPWLPMLGWLLDLRKRGKSVLLVHHDGKNETQRGASRREDQLDTVFHLKKPTDYHESEGARFVLHLGKHRGFYGKDAEPFEVALATNEQGLLEWTMTDLEDAITVQVAEMLTAGCTVSQICTKLKIGRATVDRHKKKAMATGLYDGK